MRFLLEPLIRFDITQMSYRRAETMTDEVIGELATLEAGNETGRPFFLFVNYMDAHDPWQAPGEFADMYSGRSSELPRYRHCNPSAGFGLEGPLG